MGVGFIIFFQWWGKRGGGVSIGEHIITFILFAYKIFATFILIAHKTLPYHAHNTIEMLYI